MQTRYREHVDRPRCGEHVLARPRQCAALAEQDRSVELRQFRRPSETQRYLLRQDVPEPPVSRQRRSTRRTDATRAGAIPSSTTGTPGTTIAGENGVRYYYVAKGDGLQAIAQKMYGKASMWKIIQDANKEALGERGILKIGQRLVIPPAQQ